MSEVLNNDEILNEKGKRLKLKTIDRLIWGLISGFSFGIGLVFLITILPKFERLGWVNLILLPLGLILIIDFPLFLNHLFHEIFRTVTFDNTTKIIKIENFGKTKIIDLKNNDFQAIKFKPWIAVLEHIPGAGYGKLIIIKANERFEFSETILDGSNLWLNIIKLNAKENIKEVKKQINFIW